MRSVTFKVKVKGHFKVKYRYYSQTSPNGRASCSNMVCDLEHEPQGHLKVIGGYCAQTVGDRKGNISEHACDLQGQGQRSSQGQISILYSNFTKSHGELFQHDSWPWEWTPRSFRRCFVRRVEKVDFPKRQLANISETKGRRASRFAALDAELNLQRALW
jgi:hypothetical protein